LAGIRYFVEQVNNAQLPLTLTSPFNFGATLGYAPPSYMRYIVNTSNIDGSSTQSVRVDLQGVVIRTPANATGLTIGQLPAGFWPPRQLAFVSKLPGMNNITVSLSSMAPLLF